jgi:long-chain acyl-CoA synthetase
VYDFADLIVKKEDVLEYAKVLPSDIVTFSYTSGTTGMPKGALIRHSNLLGIIAIAKEGRYSSSDVYFSYLPLPHILERSACSVLLYYGTQIGFYRGIVIY